MVAYDRAKFRRGAAGARYGSAAVTSITNSGMRTGGFIPQGWRRSANVVELKSVDNWNAGISCGAAGSINLMNGIATGSSFYNRVGRQIKMKSFQIKAFFRSNTQFSDQTYVRIALVYDAQSNGVAPTLTDLWTDYSATGATQTTPTSGINLNNRDRFRILMEETVNLPQVGIQTTNDIGTVNTGPGSSPGAKELCLHKYINLKGLVTNFKSDTNTVGDISTGGLFLVTLGSSTFTAPWTLVFSTRVRFYD